MLRKRYLLEIDRQLSVHPVCAILGARQVGKTTLAKTYIQEHVQASAKFFDLENPIDLLRLENPMLALSEIEEEYVIIDEIQFRPDLFNILRVIVDRADKKQKFLILGSASRDLIQQSSETLAGRIGYIELPPFGLFEVENSARLWMRGGFPRSYLANTDEESFMWRQNYIATYLERDIPTLGLNIPPVQLRRFWMMLTHYNRQIINFDEIAKSLIISNYLVRKYLDILAGTFMVRILQPWFENIAKRQVKSPKIYFRDTGILNALLAIKNKTDLETNPKLGSFWEGYALEEIIKFLNIRSEEAFFWSTHAEAELDLFIIRAGKRIGFEFKYADAPRTTKSMHSALHDLKLDHLIIIYPGDEQFSLTEKIAVCGLKKFVSTQELFIIK